MLSECSTLDNTCDYSRSTHICHIQADQGQWPESYGEHKFVIMFGGLHIKMNALRVHKVPFFKAVDGQQLLQRQG